MKTEEQHQFWSPQMQKLERSRKWGEKEDHIFLPSPKTGHVHFFFLHKALLFYIAGVDGAHVISYCAFINFMSLLYYYKFMTHIIFIGTLCFWRGCSLCYLTVLAVLDV